MSAKNSKSQVDRLTTLKDQLQRQLQSGLSTVEQEGKKVLNQLGADLDNEDKSLKAVVTRIRAKNNTLKDFARNIDAATYDVRGRIRWNATMMSAYAKMQAEKAMDKEVKPRLETYKHNLESRIKDLLDKVTLLKEKISH
ncbi:hypothetical protein EUZ85_12510 [Hahella sp. KA22]|uniref:hypothetical protein n=1 Tax=Hahella sp. KA22 TaxID=1628392 RepID=UPI000FDE4B17|nr:hypothetical protein [Hahella sp. KA22]AZZ91510.1 hypothetical protein ENC22_09950 [Hahella sp. KA22]QAY54879.1 hypothetical protein EUZ85_12510 [Hahella sp. KA22]